MEELRVSSWAEVLPRRVILRVAMEEMGMSAGKGGLRRPGLGEMRSFWLGVGMERVEEIEVDRSAMDDVGGRLKVWVVLPCLIVRSIVEVASADVGGMESSASMLSV